MSMNDREKAARAIGFLEGISSVLWNLDTDKAPVSVACETAGFYDDQVELLRKIVFEEKK